MYYRLLALVVGWAIYFSLHSFFASDALKNKFNALFPSVFPYYRILFNFIALIGLLPILYLHAITHFQGWFYAQGIWLYLAYFLMFSGLLILTLSFKNYRIREFLGFSYLASSKNKPNRLNTHGLNAWVRHPLYFGLILWILGYLIYRFDPENLLSAFMILLYLFIGTRLEEQKLELEFGNAYREYRKKTKMFIPFIF